MAITQLMEWWISLLRDGRFEDLARQFLFPMALYVNGGMRVITSAEALVETIRSFSKKLSAEDMKHLEIKITSVEIPREGRFRVWSDLISIPPECPVKVIGRTIHFMRETPQGVMAEMLECSFVDYQQQVAAYGT